MRSKTRCPANAQKCANLADSDSKTCTGSQSEGGHRWAIIAESNRHFFAAMHNSQVPKSGPRWCFFYGRQRRGRTR